jgi:hemerythrin-like domain-containing protein
MEFSELLIKEHEPIRRAISVLEAMASDAENGRRINRNDVIELLQELEEKYSPRAA